MRRPQRKAAPRKGNIRRPARKVAPAKPYSQDQGNKAIVLANPAPAPLVKPVSAVPSVLATVKSLEQVRRFVSRCFNIDLQKAKANLKPDEKLDPDVQKRLEVDWGTIPGVDKPFLLQPGAEKFCFWLNIRPKYFNREVELGDGHMEIVSHVVFYHKKTHEEVYEGPECSCTTKESNYRFRMQERPEDEPQPSWDEQKKLKAAGLGKPKKKAEWKGGKKVGEKWVWMDRVENPNIYDERNKVRQIGEKRALVKGVKNMGAMSELFVTSPDEWDVGEEPTDEGPDVDASYTEGGRKIILNEPGVSEHERHYNERAAKEMEKLTPEQRAVLEAKMKKVSMEAEPRRAGPNADTVKDMGNGQTPNLSAEMPTASKPTPQVKQETPAEVQGADPSPAPCLFVVQLEPNRYEIMGRENLIPDLRNILRPYWDKDKKQVIVNDEQLDAMKFEYDKHGIQIRPLAKP